MSESILTGIFLISFFFFLVWLFLNSWVKAYEKLQKEAEEKAKVELEKARKEIAEKPVEVWECPHCQQLNQMQEAWGGWEECEKCGIPFKWIRKIVQFKTVPFEDFNMQRRYLVDERWRELGSKYLHKNNLFPKINLKFGEDGQLTQLDGTPIDDDKD